MHPSHIPHGTDSVNSCKVEIDVTSFLTVEDGRSVYRKGRPLGWWVDSEEYSIIDMQNDVSVHYSWASNQEANFWYDGRDGQTLHLATDQELLTLLRASKLVRFTMTVGIPEHLVVANEANDLQLEPPIEDTELQIEPVIKDTDLQIIVQNDNLSEGVNETQSGIAEIGGLEWANDPEHGLTAAGPGRVEEEETEHYMEEQKMLPVWPYSKDLP